MGPSVVVESLDFERQDSWQQRRFSGLVTFVTGRSGIGKSTPLGALFYVLGVSSAVVMPEVKACRHVRVVFRVAGVRWSATTRPGSTRGRRVVFCDLSDPRAPHLDLPVSAGSSGERTAGDFVMELLGIPCISRGGVRLGLEQLRCVLMLRQPSISNRYLDALPADARKLLFDVLLGLRDGELGALESRLAQVAREHDQAKRLLSQFARQRARFSLDSPEAIRAEFDAKKRAHAEAAETAREAQTVLGNLAAERGRLAHQAGQAKTAFTRATGRAKKSAAQLQAAENKCAQAAGFLAGLEQQTAANYCSRCGQDLPERPDGACCQCGQSLPQDAAVRAQGAAGRALATLRAAEVIRDRLRAEAQEAEQAALGAWEELERAATARDLHDEQVWRPQQQRTLAAEKAAHALSGELTQLTRRLKDTEFLVTAGQDAARLEKERQAAKDALEAAQQERDTLRKERLQLWSQLLLARVRAGLIQSPGDHVLVQVR